MNMSILFRLAATIAALVAVNCATIFSDSEYEYNIDSDPQGVTVSVMQNGFLVKKLTTPAKHTLDLAHDYILKFEKEGYETHQIRIRKDVDVWIVGSAACGMCGFFPGVLALAVDVLSGAAWQPEQARIYWEMERKKNPTAGVPDRFVLRLTVISQDGRTTIAETDIHPGDGEQYHSLSDIVVDVR